jgi:hypothetical protein
MKSGGGSCCQNPVKLYVKQHLLVCWLGIIALADLNLKRRILVASFAAVQGYARQALLLPRGLDLSTFTTVRGDERRRNRYVQLVVTRGEHIQLYR